MKSNVKLMTKGPIASAILSFAIPIFISNFLQRLYQTIDSLVVGNFVGKEALAAITSIGPVTFLMVGFINGIFIGAGVVISKYFGANDIKNAKRAVHSDVALALLFCVIFTSFGYWFSPRILTWMNTPASVFDLANSYVRIYMLGSSFLILYNMSTGILQAFGNSKNPLYFLIISTIINILLDLLFVGKFGFGIKGAAYATIISECVSAILSVRLLLFTNEIYKVKIRKINFHGDIIKQILHIGIPSGIQNSVVSFSNVFLQASVNTFGAAAMAGNGSYARIQSFAFIPVAAFSMGIMTFVSQNIGAQEYDRVKKGIHFSFITAITTAEFLGIILYLSAHILLRGFSSDPEVIAFGMEKAQISTLFFFVVAYSHLMAGIFRGAGRSIVPMFVMLFFWCLVRVVYVTITLQYINKITVVFWAYPITWTLSSIVFTIYYFKVDWMRQKPSHPRKQRA